MRVLMVTPRSADDTVGGREQLSALHEQTLAELLGRDLVVRRLAPRSPVGLPDLIGALGGRIDGITAASEREFAADLGGFEALWLEGSNLGRLARVARRARPQLTIITFCHNVEARFFLGALRHQPGPRALAVLAANIAAERFAVRHSDRLVALSERDSALLGRWYARSATDVLSMAIDDLGQPITPTRPTGNGLLFVGGAFYANLAGIRWFAAKVAPHLSFRTKVVGRGFDAHRAELEASGMIDVVGEVDDLAPYYAEARAVIAPIFDGSGMKTKVAEALMHGRPVIGTREAFSGYEAVADQAGWRADKVATWVDAVASAMNTNGASPSARQMLYEDHFSPRALRRGIAAILGIER